MGLDSIRSSVKTKVAAVAGIAGVAPVYDYRRHVSDDKEVRDLLAATSGTGRVHFWHVHPSFEDPLKVRLRVGCQDGFYRFEVHGFYALKDADASEKAFLTIVEAVHAALLAEWVRNPNFDGTTRALEEDAPSVVSNDHRTVCGYLCHHAGITFGLRKQI